MPLAGHGEWPEGSRHQQRFRQRQGDLKFKVSLGYIGLVLKDNQEGIWSVEEHLPSIHEGKGPVRRN